MRFGEIPVAKAEGAILAHSLRHGRLTFKKGRRLGPDDVVALAEAGIESVTAARLDPGDVHEDDAATRLAMAVAGLDATVADAFTGRVNLYATCDGLCRVDAERIDRINRIDESITVATLPDLEPVTRGQMLATIKMIPFAVPVGALDLAVEAATGAASHLDGPVAVATYRRLRVGLIQTVLPSVKASVLDKTVTITRARLTPLGSDLVDERRCDHAVDALAGTIAEIDALALDLLLIAGASAITDRRDVLPAAIEAVGGRIEHFGMPVDPGNLLLLGRRGRMAVLGLPGCARSPKLNGFDWVLQRLAARQPVDRDAIMRMGVGGLLTEIPTRPQPRAGGDGTAAVPKAPPVKTVPRVAALVLAAGQSRRMGMQNKLLAPIGDRPMVAHVVDAALTSSAHPVLVVTGHEAEDVRAALAETPVSWVHNPDFATGLSTSIKAGLAALPEAVDGVLVCLGDMPGISAAVLDTLIEALDPLHGKTIVVPRVDGRRGNPILWERRHIAEMMGITGDTGAKAMLNRHADHVVEVDVHDDAVLIDFDTPEALAAGRDALATKVVPGVMGRGGG